MNTRKLSQQIFLVTTLKQQMGPFYKKIVFYKILFQEHPLQLIPSPLKCKRELIA